MNKKEFMASDIGRLIELPPKYENQTICGIVGHDWVRNKDDKKFYCLGCNISQDTFLLQLILNL